MNFDRTSSLLAGMKPADLQANLSALQQALIDLSAGRREVTVEVTGGGQHRSVTFSATSEAALVHMIRMIQAQLGIRSAPRLGARITFS